MSCDKVMCAALEAHGFPLRNLVVLGPNSHADPVPSVVVVETAAVREMFGSSLATACRTRPFSRPSARGIGGDHRASDRASRSPVALPELAQR